MMPDQRRIALPIESGLDLSVGVPQEVITAIYQNSFLLPLTALFLPDASGQRIWKKPEHRRGKEIERKRTALLTQIIPEGWYYSHEARVNFTSQRLQVKINDPVNIDHGEPHLDRFRNNFNALLPYTTDVIGLSEEDLHVFVIAGNLGIFHDDVEIDGLGADIPMQRMKEIHAHLGAVNAVGIVRAMRLRGAPIDEKVERLVFHAIFNHSYPLRVDQFQQGEISIPGVMEKYSEVWDRLPLLSETGALLQEAGGSFDEIDIALQDNEERLMAKWLLRDVYSADKRDSMVPPFLAILRTLFTDPNRPFCSNNLEDHLQRLANFLTPAYKPKDADFVTDLDRIVFEFIRDYREEGMSGFAVEWLGASMPRKWEYVIMMAKALASGNFNLIDKKYDEYAENLWQEYCAEAVGVSEAMVKSKEDKLLQSLIGLEHQRQATLQLMQQKSSGNILTASELNQLYKKIVLADRLPLLGQHAPFPDDLLPVFAVDDLPI